MRLLSVCVLLSLLLVSCSDLTVDSEVMHEIPEIVASETVEFDYPNVVKVLSETSVEVSLPKTKILDTVTLLENLDVTNYFPGTYLVSRNFVEQFVNTLLSLGHIITVSYLTNVFIYIHMEYENYTYLIWWSNNQLTLAGDFTLIREFFLR